MDHEGRASSVAKLEGGQVRNPHADTVKLYAGTLEIPQEQIDALRAPAPAFPVSDLDKLRQWMESPWAETLEGLALRPKRSIPALRSTRTGPPTP